MTSINNYFDIYIYIYIYYILQDDINTTYKVSSIDKPHQMS
jgi:hypothetical protein